MLTRGKSVVSVSLAAIMLTSIFAAMAPMGCAIWGDVTLETEDGSTIILMVSGEGLVSWVSRNVVARDDDDVKVQVLEATVTFDMPTKVIIGEDVDITGAISAGTFIDVIVKDQKQISNNKAVDENNEFTVKWDTSGMTTGSYTIEVYIDDDEDNKLDAYPGDYAGEDPDGKTTIRLIEPGLTVEQPRSVVAEDDDYTIKGTATGVDSVDYMLIGPKGWKSGTDRDILGGLLIASATVTDDEFEEDETMTDGLDTGVWVAAVLHPGHDGAYQYPIDTGITDGKTQSQILEIVDDNIHAAGSDDVMELLSFKVESGYVRLDPIANVAKGDPIEVSGVSNREPGTAITICTFAGPTNLLALTEVEWTTAEQGVFNATIDTTDAEVGTYTLEADDGDGNTDTTTLIIFDPMNYPPTASIDSIMPNPAKQGKDTISFIGHGNDSDGFVAAYNWTSSIDGLLNTSSSFTKSASELSVGTHAIYFTVQDDDGAWSSPATENLTILTNHPPVASFGYLPVNPAMNALVTFNASASYDPDGIIVSYNWSFGDANLAETTEAAITHSYAAVDEYVVNLTITDDEGATNKTSRVIKVFPDVPYFDTEAGTYPSIPGTHNGTITMTRTVNVSKIYIYPCTGTGGHIEYAKIWNTSWDGAEAHWNGYVDNWHNLSFDHNFTLVAGETYNYSIRTGSYPQIHHKHELLTARGWMTCEKFVDINGKQHEGWIPAVRLS